MANTVTRCPKCDTSFRVTDAHLNSAKGAVRCGSCLHIFNARDHLIEDEPKPAPLDEDDILISDDMDKEHEDDYTADMDSNVIFATTYGPADANLFERENLDDDEDDELDADESWAESLLTDDDDEPIAPPADSKPTVEGPSKKELFQAKDTGKGVEGQFYGTEPPKPAGSSISKNHFQLINELRGKEEQAERTHAKDEYDGVFTSEEEFEDEEYSEGDHPEEYEDAADDEPLKTPYEEFEYEPEIDDIDEIDDLSYRDQYGSTTNNRYLESIEPEPVVFAFSSRYPIWHSKGLWAGLAAVAGLLLLLQLAIFKFDDLSTVQPWRNLYGKACSFLSCELPTLEDRSKIKASNLVVRSHPNIEDALMVDVILSNTAKFSQTFPPLDLVFTDIKNKAVAARRFEAREYLGGELAGKNSMPVNTPVHIALEIADPGPEAVSYVITIPN